MAASYTYTTLVAELTAHQADAGVDFTLEIPSLIALAETRVLKDLDLTIFDATVANIAFTLNTPLVQKPTGHLATDVLIFVNGSTKVTLKRRTTGYLYDYNAAAASGVPEFFSEYDDSNWMVAKAPSSTISNGICRYNKRPDGLSSGNASTWLSANCGYLLCRAALVAASEFIQDDDMVTVFNTDYMASLAASRKEFATLIRKKE